MKKIYTAPMLDILNMSGVDLLTLSGEAMAPDAFSDSYGKTFG